MKQTNLVTGDFVFDAIGEMELAPGFPAQDSTFLVTKDRSKGQLPLLINTGPHNNPGGKYNRYSASPTERSAIRGQRTRSQDRLLAADGSDALSKKSALNERYFEDKNDQTKSRSLDNLLDGSPNAPGDFFGLSESRLNKRYQAGQKVIEPMNLSHRIFSNTCPVTAV